MITRNRSAQGSSIAGNALCGSHLALLILGIISVFSVVLRARLFPYFPGQFDDAEYWLSSYRILDEWRAAAGVEKLKALYLTRPVKPHPFPLLGVPFLSFGVHPSTATAALNSILLTALSWILYGIFRSMGLARWGALLSAGYLLLQSSIMPLSEVYLSELFFLAFASGTVLARIHGRSVVSGLLLGTALTVRPLEGGVAAAAIFITEVIVRGWRSRELKGWGVVVSIAMLVTFIWYKSHVTELLNWIIPAIFDDMNVPSVDGRYAWNLIMGIVSPVFLVTLPMAMVLEWHARKAFSMSVLAAAVFFLPVAMALQAVNITSIGETRRYVFFVALSGGIVCAIFWKYEARLLLLAVACAQLAWTWSHYRHAAHASSGVISPDVRCASSVAALARIPLRESGRVFLLTDYAQPLPCQLAARIAGRRWQMESDPAQMALPASDTDVEALLLRPEAVMRGLRSFDVVLLDRPLTKLLERNTEGGRRNLFRSLVGLKKEGRLSVLDLGLGFYALSAGQPKVDGRQ